jgi:hypothetical protein
MMPRMERRGPARAIIGSVLSVVLVGAGVGAGLVGRPETAPPAARPR